MKYEGGPVALNSGGFGPDDYLLKRVGERGGWVLVQFRWGRHFQGKELGLEAARRVAELDEKAMRVIFPLARQVCVGDCARRLEKMWKAGRAKRMWAADFVRLSEKEGR
jgi:hypothetical protein